MKIYRIASYFDSVVGTYFIDRNKVIRKVEYEHLHDIMEYYDLEPKIASLFEETFGFAIDWDREWYFAMKHIFDFMKTEGIFNIVVDVQEKQVYVRPTLGEFPNPGQMKEISDWAIEHRWNERVVIDYQYA